MTVMIKGMKKPTVCYKCPLRTGKYCGILTENEKCADDGVLPHCPIAEVSEPHGRLIDADRMHDILEYVIEESARRGFHQAIIGVVKAIDKNIDDIPTVIESEEEDE